jgi:hypothetical protein
MNFLHFLDAPESAAGFASGFSGIQTAGDGILFGELQVRRDFIVEFAFDAIARHQSE